MASDCSSPEPFLMNIHSYALKAKNLIPKGTALKAKNLLPKGTALKAKNPLPKDTSHKANNLLPLGGNFFP